MLSIHFSTKLLPWRTWIFFSVSCLLLSSSLSDPRISLSGLFCGTNKPPPGVSLVPPFVQEMQGLSQLITTSGHFAIYRFRSSPIPLYALAQCHRDLSETDCLLCYAASRTRLPRCLPAISGRIFLDGCFLRYDNYSFFQESVSSIFDSVNCSAENATISGFNRVGFVRDVGYAVGNVTAMALENRGFGIWATEGVYALAQCWETLSTEGCQRCLEKAANAVKSCPPKKEGRAMNAGCYLRYSTDKFYGKDSTHGHGGIWVISAIVIATIAVLMVFFSAIYAVYARMSRMKRDRQNLGQISLSFNKSGLGFKYETLEKATDYFSPSRKLGQGGNGSLFMGIYFSRWMISSMRNSAQEFSPASWLEHRRP